MSKPPLILSVSARPPATLDIAWSTGETLPVNVSRLLKRYKLYRPLTDPRFFGKANPGAWGHAVRWPGEIDMSADQLYEIAREQAGEWGPEKFSAWMERHELSLTSAADALDLSRRTIANYRAGGRPIPRVVALACEGLAARWAGRAA